MEGSASPSFLNASWLGRYSLIATGWSSQS